MYMASSLNKFTHAGRRMKRQMMYGKIQQDRIKGIDEIQWRTTWNVGLKNSLLLDILIYSPLPLLSYHILPSHIISSHIIYSRIIYSPILSYHILSYHLISSHLLSSPLILYHLISSHHLLSSRPLSSPLISSSPLILSHVLLYLLNLTLKKLADASKSINFILWATWMIFEAAKRKKGKWWD